MPIDPENVNPDVYYDEHQADPRSKYDRIESGLREHSTQSCQYWIKGLSAKCSYWDEDGSSCTYTDQFDETATVNLPSGYNGGKCDYLGRRHICDKHTTTATTDLNTYWCVAPNIFLTGLGTKSTDANGKPVLTPIPKESIPGYCNGRCDESGRGTGCGGTPGATPIVCSYYRPFQMGFGADEPHGLDYHYDASGQRVIEADALTRAYAAATLPMTTRLPFAFKLYNLRAHFQKCAYWDDETGARFLMEDSLGAEVYLNIDPADYCTCTSESAIPYYTTSTSGSLGISDWLLQNVWCDGQTVVCNGAKPECPCYTSEWLYLTDEKMQEGMRITANQIFELRFWAADWGTQEEYDEFFTAHPNFSDATTTSIYTFSKWARQDKPEESQPQGKKLDMCVPAILNRREFDPDLYLTIEEITYPKFSLNIGTSSPNYEQVYFPSLIRDPDTEDMYIRPFSIIYPYSASDPFSTAEACEDRVDPICVKQTCRMDNDELTAVGVTIRNSDIYVINLNYYEGHDSDTYPESSVPEFKEYKQASAISDEPLVRPDADPTLTGLSPREAFFIRLERFIEFCDKTDEEGIARGMTTNDGFFKVGPVGLQLSETNKIVICVQFSDNTWDFRIREVNSQWCGGVTLQKSFKAEVDSSGNNHLPEYFGQPAEIEGEIKTFAAPAVSNACNVGSVFPVPSKKYFDRFGAEKKEYSYCIKKKTVSTVVDTWARIGQTTYVWIDIFDPNINYIFEWGIEDDGATMNRIDDEEEESCGGVTNSVDMEVVDIETFVSGGLSVPPSVRILKPKDDILVGFLNSKWTLNVTYWYKYMATDDDESENDEIIWPDFTDPDITFSTSNLDIRIDTDSGDFFVEGIRNKSVALMTYFVDDNLRLVSCFATKLIVQVVDIKCRNVEIKYVYTAPAVGWKVQPDTSQGQLADARWADVPMSQQFNHYYAPPCGDHKLSAMTGTGHCWYPFDACDNTDFYQEFAGGGFCTNDFPDTPRNDMRFCGPPKYKAFVEAGGGLADCLLPWRYRYSVGDSTMFGGSASIIHWVDIPYYLAQNPSWAIPPFGNVGREMTTRWLSTDHWKHVSAKDTLIPSVKSQWVPMVPDVNDFFISFNAFDEEYEADPFAHTNQLSFMIKDSIGETLQGVTGIYDRKRFEEVYGIHATPFATYPPPIYTSGAIAAVAFYYFIDPEIVWAWQELWKNIEYFYSRTFFFATYEKPDYVYDYRKEEFRYICDEGIRVVHFIKPEIVETELVKFPAINLGRGLASEPTAGFPRYFEIRYDDYDSDYVDWRDENEGHVDGSGGDESTPGDAATASGGNIYEKTSGDEWTHDEHTIFDDEAVDNPAAATTSDREINAIDDITGDLISTYFNRGIIAHITKDRLKYLPYIEKPAIIYKGDDWGDSSHNAPTPNIVPAPQSGAHYFVDYKFYNISPIYTYLATVHPEDSGEGFKIDLKDGKCISKVIITGVWGRYGDEKLCKPGVIITADGVTLYSLAAVEVTDSLFPSVSNTRREFRMEIKLDVTPDRMIGLEEEFKIQLVNVTGQWIAVNVFELFAAEYTDSTETLQIWERKYNYSKASSISQLGDFPLNGPKVGGVFPIQYEVDLDNAGVYFPASPAAFSQFWGEVTAKDKMRAAYVGTQYREDTRIEATASNLVDVEQKEQRNLYQEAYDLDVDGDMLSFTGIKSPPFDDFLTSLGLLFPSRPAIPFETEKVQWEHHNLVNNYVTGVLWQPLGHKYQWGDRVELIYCYEMILGHIQGAEVYRRYTIFRVEFYHLDLQSSDTVIDAPSSLRWGRLQYQLDVVGKLYGESAWANITGAADPLAIADTIIDTPVVGAGGEFGGGGASGG